MKFILARKIEMSQIFDGNGRVQPVTWLEAGPIFVTQKKSEEKDGYVAVQVGFSAKKGKNVEKPQKKLGNFQYFREFKTSALNVGDKIEATAFEEGDFVNVSGVSKGKGFQGVVKRHGFHGGPKSHGQKDRHRAPGSIGASWPQFTIKGMRMAGRMGGDKVTVKNLEIVEVDRENNLIALKGAIPGRRGTLIMMKSS